MKLYTYYTPSHAPLFEGYFLPSLRQLYSERELPCEASCVPQVSDTGAWSSPGFNETTERKFDVLARACAESGGDPFLFSDVDVQFLRPFLDHLHPLLDGVDMAFQEDRGEICSGFFIARGTERVATFLAAVRRRLQEEQHRWNDQIYFNELAGAIRYRLLPRAHYYTVGNYYTNRHGNHLWFQGDDFEVPREVRVHHANFVIGVPRKIQILELVRDRLRRQGA